MKMLKTTCVGLALLFGTGTLALTPVSASPLGSLNNYSEATGLTKIEQVQLKKKRWQYNRWQHGDRKRKRDRHYRHHRDGFWYSTPFWLSLTLPLAAQQSGSAHVRWCYNRYRSYDARTDSFMGYDGRRHRCNSPY
jgi:hypothetical protein